MTIRDRIWMCSGVAFTLVTTSGCGPEPTHDEIDEQASPVINGTLVTSANPPANPGTVAVYHAFVRPCSGTLVRRQWVLTARHCVTTDPHNAFSPLLDLSSVKVVRTTSPGLNPPPGGSQAVTIIGHDTEDIALVRISPEIASPVGLSNASLASLPNTFVRAMGYGRANLGGPDGEEIPFPQPGNTGAGTLRRAELPVSLVADGMLRLVKNSSGQILWSGDSGGPSYKMTDLFGRQLPGIAGVHSTSDGTTQSFDTAVEPNRRWIKQWMYSAGSFLGGPRGGIAMVGGSGWASIPTLYVDIESADSGGPFFFTTNQVVADFPSWAQDTAAKAVSADFNGDRRADIALMGGSGWTTVPVAFASDSGTFSVTNVSNPTLANLTAPADARVTSGDYDGDGKGDIVIMRGSSSNVRVAFSLGAGSFTTTGGVLLGNNFLNVSAPGARLLSGDFDGDGRDDITLLGNSTQNVPIAFSNGGSGSFLVMLQATTLASWAATAGTKVAIGDFNGDGRDDIAVTGGSGWTDIRVGFSTGNGSFTLSQFPIPNFSSWSQTPGVRMVSGDYSADGTDDLALVGGPGWGSVPIAFAHPGSFFETNNPTEFAAWAQQSGPIKVLSGH